MPMSTPSDPALPSPRLLRTNPGSLGRSTAAAMRWRHAGRAITFMLLLAAGPGFAATAWHCRNADLEVTCDDGRCASNESFTPLDVTLRTDGHMEVCAYSGCFSGRGKVLRSGRHTFFVGDRLAPQGAGPPMAFVLMVDATDRIGFVKGASFAMPLACERR